MDKFTGMEKAISTAVVGYGMSAQVFHLPFLATNPQYHLHSVLRRNGEPIDARFGTPKIYTTIDEVVIDKDVELVVVTTPNNTHFPFAQAALEAGKHVVLEKPFTIRADEALQLLQIAESNGCMLSVYHNRRYVSDFKTIAGLLAESKLGEVHEYICHFDRYRPEAKENAWREKAEPGSGILYDLGSHLIDQSLCLFGLPTNVTGFIKQQRPHARTDDYFDVRFDFANGCTAIMKGSMLVREMGPRYTLHGTLGSFIKYGDDPQEALLKEGIMPNTEDWGKEDDMFKGLLHTEKDGEVIKQRIPSLPGNFGDYYINLAHAIRGEATLREHPAHGYNVVKLIELAIESNAQRKTIPAQGLLNVPYPAIHSYA